MITRDEFAAQSQPPHDRKPGQIRSRYRTARGRELGSWGFALLWPAAGVVILDAFAIIGSAGQLRAFHWILVGTCAAIVSLSVLCYVGAGAVDRRAAGAPVEAPATFIAPTPRPAAARSHGPAQIPPTVRRHVSSPIHEQAKPADEPARATAENYAP